MEYTQRLDEIERRFDSLTQQMADPAIINDSDTYRKTAKSQSELEEVVARYREYKQDRGSGADAMRLKPRRLKFKPTGS